MGYGEGRGEEGRRGEGEEEEEKERRGRGASPCLLRQAPHGSPATAALRAGPAFPPLPHSPTASAARGRHWGGPCPARGGDSGDRGAGRARRGCLHPGQSSAEPGAGDAARSAVPAERAGGRRSRWVAAVVPGCAGAEQSGAGAGTGLWVSRSAWRAASLPGELGCGEPGGSRVSPGRPGWAYRSPGGARPQARRATVAGRMGPALLRSAPLLSFPEP